MQIDSRKAGTGKIKSVTYLSAVTNLVLCLVKFVLPQMPPCFWACTSGRKNPMKAIPTDMGGLRLSRPAQLPLFWLSWVLQ